MLQEILNRFSDPNYLTERLNALSPQIQYALQEITLEGKEEFAEAELLTLLRRRHPLSDKSVEDEPHRLLSDLLEEGIFFATGSPSQRAYRCPTEIWSRILNLETKKLRQTIQESSRTPQWVRNDFNALAHDAVTFLLFLARHEIKLTQDGVIFKRQQSQILQLFEIKEDILPAHIGFRFGYGRRFHDYPDRFALLYDHLYAEGCLIEDPSGVLLLNEEKSGTYLTQSEDIRQEKLFRFYMRTYRSSIPTLWRIVSRMGKLTANTWVYAQSLEQSLLAFVTDFYYESKTQIYPNRILQMLIYLGFIAQGTDTGGDVYYQLTENGERWLETTKEVAKSQATTRCTSRPLAVIQPTFEILVPQEADHVYTWDLQKLAEPVHRDHISIYRLTRDSIYHAMLNGWTLLQIREFLQTISGAEIPENVDRCLNDWGEEYGSISMQMYCVVTCKDQETSESLEQLDAIVKRSPVRLNPQSLGFAVGDADSLLDLFIKLGFLVAYPLELKTQFAKQS
ncbi:helicase-associated domain-containing protein [Sulfoacidibacillus thermotolerans]|uniref:helicase-associated domain-containing protein n=1 Tax=Sulfoacidibacillus thermotolerans TaxID=1765684 RepID=UPI0015E829C5|nr:helicase-associated domain-containing protein [Sulfoacidibacillus thermotolerans]